MKKKNKPYFKTFNNKSIKSIEEDIQKLETKIQELNEITDYIAISNYYKYSLNTGTTDINPETKIEEFIKDKKGIYSMEDMLSLQ